MKKKIDGTLANQRFWDYMRGRKLNKINFRRRDKLRQIMYQVFTVLRTRAFMEEAGKYIESWNSFEKQQQANISS